MIIIPETKMFSSQITLVKESSTQNRNSMRSLRLINLITGSCSVFQFLFLARARKKIRSKSAFKELKLTTVEGSLTASGRWQCCYSRVRCWFPSMLKQNLWLFWDYIVFRRSKTFKKFLAFTCLAEYLSSDNSRAKIDLKYNFSSTRFIRGVMICTVL